MDIKAAFFRWEFKTLAAVARYLGIRPDSRAFKAATAGWKDERAAIEAPALGKTLAVLSDERAAEKLRDLYVDALATYYRLWDIICEASKSFSGWKEPHKTPWASQAVAAAVIETSKAMERLMPAIRGLENLRVVQNIFDDLTDGKTDIVQASLALAKLGVALPRPVEIMLSRHKPDESPPDDGEYITDAMILERRAKILAQIETERTDFVQQRKEEVRLLKAETADSFKVQKEIETEHTHKSLIHRHNPKGAPNERWQIVCRATGS